MKIYLFGVLADITKQDVIDSVEAENVRSLRAAVLEKYPRFAEHSFRVAVNRRLASDDLPLRLHDEIALLPPYSGG